MGEERPTLSATGVRAIASRPRYVHRVCARPSSVEPTLRLWRSDRRRMLGHGAYIRNPWTERVCTRARPHACRHRGPARSARGTRGPLRPSRSTRAATNAGEHLPQATAHKSAQETWRTSDHRAFACSEAGGRLRVRRLPLKVWRRPFRRRSVHGRCRSGRILPSVCHRRRLRTRAATLSGPEACLSSSF